MPRPLLILLIGSALAHAQVPSLTAENFARLPLSFEKQTDEQFLARGRGYAIGIDHGRLTLAAGAHAVSLQFTGARSDLIPQAGPELAGKINEIRGNDPKKWRIGIPTYARVSYADVYPGIDVVWYGNQQQLEFDLIVKPGADPDSIRLKIDGADKLSLDPSGTLHIDGFRLTLPQVYQEIDGVRKSIPGHFAMIGLDEVAFRLDPFDHSHTLVIDPTIVYSTMFAEGTGYGVAVDSSGNMLYAGAAGVYQYSGQVNSYQSLPNGYQNAFVTKLDPTGNLIYTTYLGGSVWDEALALAVDSTGAAWITGYTESSNFPTLHAAQGTFSGYAFVARLDGSGILQFSTFLGGLDQTYAEGIAVDSQNNGYVTGYGTDSFPTTPGVVETSGGEAFVTKYSSTGSVLYSTLLGGANTYGYGIAADSSGNAYVTGYSSDTAFTGMPAGGAQTTNNGNNDAFVAKLNATGTQLTYFTFFGGSAADSGKAITVDSTGDAFITGQTGSTGLATSGAPYTTLNGPTNGFVAELNPDGTQFTWVTYLGGSRTDNPQAIALDGSANVVVAGFTNSANFPVVSAVQPQMPGISTAIYNRSVAGGAWTAFDATLPGATYAISINPSDTSIVALTEGGIYRTTNNGASWTQQLALISAYTNDASWGYALARSPVAPGTIFAAFACCLNSDSWIYQSTDDGVTWSLVGNVANVTGLVADPLIANTVYAWSLISPYVFKSVDGGATWNQATSGLTGVTQGAPLAEIGPIVGTSDGSLYAAADLYGMYKSVDQGASWTAVNTGLPSLIQIESVSASGTTVYFTTSETIYETTNGGETWSIVTAPWATGQIAVAPENPSILYAFTDSVGVFESSDGGTTWNPAGTGFPPYLGYYSAQLVIDPVNPENIFAVTSPNSAAFVTRMSTSNAQISWSTYLGGAGATRSYGVAADGMGDAFIVGQTATDAGFPSTTPALLESQGAGFLTEISTSTGPCTLTVNPGSFIQETFQIDAVFSVLAPSGCTWTASSNQTWAEITAGASGTGSGTVVVALYPNSASATRVANLSIGSQNVPITQTGNGCAYSIPSYSYSAPVSGGTVEVSLTTPDGCPWVIENNYPSEVTLLSSASGTGSTAIQLSVGPNLSLQSRSLQIVVGHTSFTIDQPAYTGPLTQTITFGTLPNVTLSLSPLTLTAIASSHLPVGYVSNFPSVCTVSGSILTLLTIGQCSVTASQPGNSLFPAATPVTQTFYIVQTQSITFGPLPNLGLGTPPFVVSVSASSGLPVTVVSQTTSVCTVTGLTVTLLQTGPCTLYASQAGNSSYAPAPGVTQTFQVGPPQIITFNAPATQKLGAAPFALSASATSGLPVTFTSDTTNVCTVSGVTLTIVAWGTCSITASQSGNSTWPPAISVTKSFTVLGKIQTITFGTIAQQKLTTGSISISATTTSGLPVSFASNTTPECSVDGNEVTLLETGTCSITASQAGNAVYQTATPVTRTFTIIGEPQTISFAPLTSQALGSMPPALTASASSGLTVAFASSTPSTCSVSGADITLLAGGKCSIVASQPGNATYAAAPSITQSFTVLQTQTIVFNTPPNLALGSTPAALTASSSSGLKVTFASNTTSICTISAGTLKPLVKGNCSITASQAGNAAYAPAVPVTQTFWIGQAQTISFGALSEQTMGASAVTLNATATSGLAVNFTSNTPATCAVSGTSLTIAAGGQCSVTASQPGNDEWAAAAPVTQTFTILSLQTITFGPFSNLPLTAPPSRLTATASSGLPVTFASSTKNVCSVTGSMLTVLALGTCSITASQPGNSAFAPANPATQIFQVLQPQTISFTPPAATPLSAITVALTATANSGLTVAFASNNTSVCTVTGATVTIVQAGVCSITASQAGNSIYAAAPSVTQKFEITGPGTQTISFSAIPNQILGISPFSATAVASSGLPVTLTSTTPAVCTTTGNLVSLVSTGTCSITASQAGNSVYAPAPSVTRKFNVTGPGGISFSAIPNQILGISPFPVTAVSSSGMPVTFTSTTPAVCRTTVNLISLVSAGTCSITASQAENTATQSFSVTKAKPSNSFAQASNSPFAAADAVTIVVADFNGDGKPDIATANYEKGTVTVLLGDGTGNFTPAKNSPLPAGLSAWALATGDFNADGFPDLAVADYFGDHVWILLGDGSGNFSTAPGTPVSVPVPVSVVVGDFNADGIEDLALGSLTGDPNTVIVLLGDGSGNFAQAPGSPFSDSSTPYPRGIVTGDFNGDGVQDLAVMDGSDSFSVLLGAGNGRFSTASFSPVTVCSGPGFGAVGDFNDDGLDDLAVACPSPSHLDVLVGKSGGGFNVTENDLQVTNPQAIVTGDFNGDGVQDLATADYEGNNVAILIGNGAGQFAAPTYLPSIAGTTPINLVTADFNGDGILDLAVADLGSGKVTVYLGVPN